MSRWEGRLGLLVLMVGEGREFWRTVRKWDIDDCMDMVFLLDILRTVITFVETLFFFADLYSLRGCFQE